MFYGIGIALVVIIMGITMDGKMGWEATNNVNVRLTMSNF